MNTTLKKYFRFWFWIDVVGLFFSSLLIIAYLIWGDNFSDHIQNLWSNLSIEVLGVWLSVRIIDFLIQKHKNFKETRLQQIRNFEAFDDVAHYVHMNGPRVRDIDILNREIVYFDKRWPKIKKKFYKDEKDQITTIRESMSQIIETCIQMALYSNEDFSEVDYNKCEELLQDQLHIYRSDLEELRENIWEESHPDD